jgi:hypothetical protein
MYAWETDVYATRRIKKSGKTVCLVERQGGKKCKDAENTELVGNIHAWKRVEKTFERCQDSL